MATGNLVKEVFLTPPLSIAGCSLWLDAADPSTITGTSSVTKVNDKSGNAVNLSNATGYSYPNNTFNGTYPSFFSSNGAASASAANLGYNAAFALTMPFSLFFVGIQTNTGTFGYLCDAAPASGGANRIYTYTPSLNFDTPFGGGGSASSTNFIIDILYVAGTSASSVFVNGSSYVTGTIGQFTCSGITVANRFSLNEGFPGHICEVLAFNAGVTTTQRQQIEGYLAWKWGIQRSLVSGHPFRSSSPYQTLRVPYSIGNAVIARSSSYFFPTAISGCALWLDGADPAGNGVIPAAGNLATWVDKSGGVINAIAGTAVYPQYTTSFLNGLGVVGLTNPADYFTVANNLNSASLTYIFLMRPTTANTGTYCAILSTDTPSLYGRSIALNNMNFQIEYYTNFTTTSITTNSSTWYIVSVVFNGTSSITLSYNGTISTYAGSGTGTNSNGLTIGSYNSTSSYTTYNANFYLAEAVVYTSALSQAQYQQVEGYLAWKWGLRQNLLSTHPNNTTPYVPFPFPNRVPLARAEIWSPLRISGSQLWMDGSDPAGTGAAPANGAIVSSWVDKSGNGNSGTAVGTGAAYSSSQKALLFGSLTASPTGGQTSFPSGNYYTTSYTAAPTFETCFVVFNMPVIGYGFIITSNSCGGRSLATPVFSGSIASFAGGVVCYTWGVTGLASITASTTYIGELISISGSQTATVNGGTFAGPVSQSYSSGTTTVIGGYGVGNFAYYNGYVYEILFYNSILTTSQRQQVEGYLAWKWGVNTSLPGGHPYINFPPSP